MAVRRAAKKLRSACPIKRRGHYCELFTCRVGFTILALDYATSLNGFVLRYVIKKSLVFSCDLAKIKNIAVFRHISLYFATLCYTYRHVIPVILPMFILAI